MTDQHTPTDDSGTGPEDPAAEHGDAEAPTTPEPTDQDQDDAEDLGKSKAAREAKRYRLALRETEAERDALADTVADLRRQIVDDAVAQTVNPAGFALAGHDPAEFFTEEGTLDRAKLTAAAREAASRFGLRTPKVPDPGMGARDTPAPSSADAWQAAFSPRR